MNIAQIKFFPVMAILAISVLCVFSNAAAQTITDAQRQAMIAQIQQQLLQIKQQISQMPTQQGNVLWCHTFLNVYLAAGAKDATTGGEVSYLQTALTKQGFNVSGDSQGTIGGQTKNAIIQFQSKYKITQTGTVGPKTRAKLNALYGCEKTVSNSSGKPNCTPKWQCGSWSQSSNGQQTRSCKDSNNCGTTAGEPPTTQSCTTRIACNYNSDCGFSGYTGSPFCQTGNVYQIYATYICNNPGLCSASCTGSSVAQLKTTCDINHYCQNGSCNYTCTPSWSCTGFGACVSGVQTQTCYDKNSCHNAANEPILAKSCH